MHSSDAVGWFLFPFSSCTHAPPVLPLLEEIIDTKRIVEEKALRLSVLEGGGGVGRELVLV